MQIFRCVHKVQGCGVLAYTSDAGFCIRNNARNRKLFTRVTCYCTMCFLAATCGSQNRFFEIVPAARFLLQQQ